MTVEVKTSSAHGPGRAWVRRRVSEIARAAGTRAAEVSVLLCGDRRMRTLNRRYRGLDRPTDVLAFPARNGGAFLGDIAICVPYASRQARRAGEPLSREVGRLLLHGLLHLMGYDHERDQGEMDGLEAKLQRRLKMVPSVPPASPRGDRERGRA